MHFTTTFLRGLGVVLPIALTLYLVVWAVREAEALMKPLALLLMPSAGDYVPGSGLVLAIALVYLTGLLVQLFVIEWLVGLGQHLLERTPLVKSIYNALNDFMSYILRRPSETASRVVNVKLADELSLVGFITDPDPTALRAPGDPEDRVAVYLPMSLPARRIHGPAAARSPAAPRPRRRGCDAAGADGGSGRVAAEVLKALSGQPNRALVPELGASARFVAADSAASADHASGR